jgi:hypothetical protein
MRPMLVLGWGLAGVVATAQLAAAQPAAAPAQPPALAQLAPAAPPPEAHPWYVKPESGAWMICVKSYAKTTDPRSDPKAAAEELAREIRETYRVPAYLFEKGSEQRRKQEETIAREKARQIAEQAEFTKKMDEIRRDRETKGMDFLDTPLKVRVPKYNTLDEQWAVLIGGWKDMDAARKQLDTVRTWQPPKNANLMDRGVIVRGEGAGQSKGEYAVINPYRFAMVVPNPVVGTRTDAQKAEAYAVLQRLNEKEELSLLRVSPSYKTPYTIVVKSFHPPVRIRDKDGEKSLVEKVFSRDEGAKELHAVAQQAAALATALRDPKFRPHPLEAYVLHTLYGSLVCVGQFDGDHPEAMLATQQELDRITFNVRQDGQVTEKSHVRLFDPMFALPIPQAR